LDSRFDFSHAFWLIAGIAGGNPDRTSLASAVWAHWIVDGDLGYEIDAREMPSDWSTGYIPMRKTRPFEQPATPVDGQVYELDRDLQHWAFEKTRSIPISDSESLKEARQHFDGASAQQPPMVLLGDEMSSSTFWHGKLSDAWATEWLNYFTGNKGQFATTAMEDTGTLQSLRDLANAGRVDWQRILVLRTVSNFDQQPRGMTAAESLAHQRIGTYSAYLPALEAAYRVGHRVASELMHDWPDSPIRKTSTTVVTMNPAGRTR
jgi:purine nucleoside permease